MDIQKLENAFAGGLGFRIRQVVKSSVLLNRASRTALDLHQSLTGRAPTQRAQLRALEVAPPPSPRGKRVLIFSVRGWPLNMAWLTTIARALHLRRAETLTIACDRLLPACEPRTMVDDFASTCDLCRRRSALFLDTASLPYRWLSAFVTPEEVKTFLAQTAALSLDELEAYTAGGLPIGQLVRASVQRHLLRGALEERPEHVAAYRRFVAAGLAVQVAIGRLLNDFRPEAVLAMNGVFYAEAILLEIARARGIAVWTYERAKRVGSIILAHNQPVVKQEFEEKWAIWSQTSLSAPQADALDAYLEARAAGDVGVEPLWPEMQSVGQTVAGKRTAALFTNVSWDTAVYNSDIGFEAPPDWLRYTIRWFAERPDLHLIIRIHPAEVRVPFKHTRDPVLDSISAGNPQLPPNVRLIGPEETANSYLLLEQADVVLVYTSTIGLEAALMAKPVVVAGRVHYRHKGFTLDPDTREAYGAALVEAFGSGGMTPAESELARRYAYHYFFTENIPFPAVEEFQRAYPRFTYRDNDALRPGRDAALDAICESLLTGKVLANPFA
jgi:hypothetical protein